jgi:predicted MPP superfamily phosphohydrolase
MTVAFVVAISVLLGLLLFLIREVRRPPGPAQLGRAPRWPKRLRVTLDVIILLIAVLIFYGFLIEPNRLVVRHETIALARWPQPLDGFKIAVLSDIHVNGSFIDDDKVRTIVRRTNELQPDMIVILGDYMSSNGLLKRRVEPEEFAPLLRDFQAPFGTFSVLGNHDWWYNGARIRTALEANGVNVLENDLYGISSNGGTFWLVGLSDLWTRPQRVEQTIANVEGDQPIIALTHNPDIFPNVPQRVQLLLAGHTHGGQVRFPLIGTVVEASDFGERYVRGHVVENNHDLFVTTGIGTSIMPVRFGVPPEIVLLTLKSK